MKIIIAARFSLLAFAAAVAVTYLWAGPGLRIVGVLLPRQVWLSENGVVWMTSWWLWLLAIFSWMVLLAAWMWSYLPGHRLNSMLQSGLMVIAAVLTIGGVIIWMNVLPWAASHESANEFVALTDTLALTFVGAGLFMVGAVTAWICIDLARQDAVPVWLPVPGLLAGLLWLPAPFVLPNPIPTALGALAWIIWCLLLGARRSMPNAFAEWK